MQTGKAQSEALKTQYYKPAFDAAYSGTAQTPRSELREQLLAALKSGNCHITRNAEGVEYISLSGAKTPERNRDVGHAGGLLKRLLEASDAMYAASSGEAVRALEGKPMEAVVAAAGATSVGAYYHAPDIFDRSRDADLCYSIAPSSDTDRHIQETALVNAAIRQLRNAQTAAAARMSEEQVVERAWQLYQERQPSLREQEAPEVHWKGAEAIRKAVEFEALAQQAGKHRLMEALTRKTRETLLATKKAALEEAVQAWGAEATIAGKVRKSLTDPDNYMLTRNETSVHYTAEAARAVMGEVRGDARMDARAKIADFLAATGVMSDHGAKYAHVEVMRQEQVVRDNAGAAAKPKAKFAAAQRDGWLAGGTVAALPQGTVQGILEAHDTAADGDDMPGGGKRWGANRKTTPQNTPMKR